MSDNSQMAIDILQATHDGHDLDPRQLGLLQAAVNGHLTAEGLDVFSQLHDQVVNGNYRKPWLNGVEYVTIDHEGYVYWKGRHIEHFNRPWAWSEKGAEQTHELSRRCLLLEKAGKDIDVRTVIWQWQEPAPPAETVEP